MSKEKSNTPEEFNLLNMDPANPFNDGLEISVIDETSETSIQENVPVVTQEHDEINEPGEEVKTAKQEAPKKEAPKKAEPKVETKKVETTEPAEDEEEESSEPDGNTEEETEENNLHTFAEWLDEKGVVSLIPDKKVESEEDLVEVIQSTINKGIDDYKNSHSEEVQKFIDFVDNGGNPRDFHRIYYEESSWKDADVTNESHQEAIIRATYERTGMDKEDIDSQINDLKDLGKLETLAKKMVSKLIAEEDQEKQSLIEAQKEYQKRQEELAKKQWDDFREDLYKKEDVNGFKLTPKLKDELWKFMTTVDKKSGKTGLQIHNETNKDAQILYAYLAYNNWDITKLEKQVKTKVTSELNKTLKNITDSRKKISGGSSDSFKDKKGGNNFSAFRSIVNQI